VANETIRNEDTVKLNDPQTYREMSTPFPDADTANESIRSFFDDVAAARKRHHIRDALVVVAGSTTYPDGEEGEYHTLMHLGDSRNGPVLAAYALGETQAEMRERINALAAGKRDR